jgi:hypothetical protein
MRRAREVPYVSFIVAGKGLITGTAIHAFDAMVGTIAKLVKAAKVSS